jgi:hypothetical protein
MMGLWGAFHLFKAHCLSSSLFQILEILSLWSQDLLHLLLPNPRWKSASVTAAIAGARAAATQFSKKDHKAATSSETGTQEQSWGSHGDSSSVDGNVPSIVHGSSAYLQNQNPPSIFQSTPPYSQNPNSEPQRSPRLEFGASNRVSIDIFFSFIYFWLVNLFFLAVLILFLKNELTCLVIYWYSLVSVYVGYRSTGHIND